MDKHIYFIISFIDDDAESWHHWELFENEKDAEEEADRIIESREDIYNYSIRPIPVRSSWK